MGTIIVKSRNKARISLPLTEKVTFAKLRWLEAARKAKKSNFLFNAALLFLFNFIFIMPGLGAAGTINFNFPNNFLWKFSLTFIILYYILIVVQNYVLG